MRAGILPVALLTALIGTGCAAAYDGDGEPVVLVGGLPDADATPIVVDTDLGGDDLAALAFLLLRPDVRIEAVTIAATGLVGCDDGVDLVVDLAAGLGEPSVPIACGRSDGARPMPEDWREAAAGGTGLPRLQTTLAAEPEPAPAMIGRLAASVDHLQVVALGPLTNLGDLARQQPQAYRRLAGVTTMAGAIDSDAVDGVAEWNAAADPAALTSVLSGPVPVTVVPDDAVPDGTPESLAASPLAPVAEAAGIPRWWDLATAAAFVEPAAADVSEGTWTVDASGRLTRADAGSVKVVRSLDGSMLTSAYDAAFS